jgi:hypothetical protein
MINSCGIMSWEVNVVRLGGSLVAIPSMPARTKTQVLLTTQERKAPEEVGEVVETLAAPLEMALLHTNSAWWVHVDIGDVTEDEQRWLAGDERRDEVHGNIFAVHVPVHLRADLLHDRVLR